MPKLEEEDKRHGRRIALPHFFPIRTERQRAIDLPNPNNAAAPGALANVIVEGPLKHGYPIRVKYAKDVGGIVHGGAEHKWGSSALPVIDAEFKESEHKRDEEGKFTETGGGEISGYKYEIKPHPVFGGLSLEIKNPEGKVSLATPVASQEAGEAEAKKYIAKATKPKTPPKPAQPRQPQAPRQPAHKPSTSGLSAGLQTNIDRAGKYLPQGFLKNIKLEQGDPGTKAYATAKANRIALSPDLANEHPAMVAAVLYHEMIHQKQDYRTMNSIEREYEAHTETSRWATNQMIKAKDPAERAALRKAIKEADDMAGYFARMRYGRP